VSMGRFNKKTFRNVSIRHSNDVVKVVIFSDGRIIYRGSAPVNHKVKVAQLLSDMEAKGVIFPK